MSKLNRLTKKLRKLELALIAAETPVTYGRGSKMTVGEPNPAEVQRIQKQIEYVKEDIADWHYIYDYDDYW